MMIHILKNNIKTVKKIFDDTYLIKTLFFRKFVINLSNDLPVVSEFEE